MWEGPQCRDLLPLLGSLTPASGLFSPRLLPPRRRRPQKPSFDGFEVGQQLLFQMPARGLLNCMPFLRDRLLLRLPLLAGPRVNRVR